MAIKPKDTVDIPAGYVVTISSWENDADASSTQQIWGLTSDDVSFLKEFLSPFSLSGWEGGIGNMYEPDEAELDKYRDTLLPIIQKWKDKCPILVDLNLGDDDDVFNAVCELTNEYLGQGGSEFYSRVLDSIIVQEHPAFTLRLVDSYTNRAELKTLIQ